MMKTTEKSMIETLKRITDYIDNLLPSQRHWFIQQIELIIDEYSPKCPTAQTGLIQESDIITVCKCGHTKKNHIKYKGMDLCSDIDMITRDNICRCEKFIKNVEL